MNIILKCFLHLRWNPVALLNKYTNIIYQGEFSKVFEDEKLFVINLLIFTASRTVPNDHLWLISPNWIKSWPRFKEHLCEMLQLICECHSDFSPCCSWFQYFYISHFLSCARDKGGGNFQLSPPFPHLENDFPVHWNSRSESFCIWLPHSFKREQIVFKVIAICLDFSN